MRLLSFVWSRAGKGLNSKGLMRVQVVALAPLLKTMSHGPLHAQPHLSEFAESIIISLSMDEYEICKIFFSITQNLGTRINSGR
jgi:hypothetical protein